MALTETNDLAAPSTPPGAVARLRAQARTWLRSEHGAAQRMAGMAFAIRVASAGVTFLSQIALARWMGGFDFGIYVSVWTWLLLVADVVHLGLPLVAQRFIPEYAHRNELDALRGFLIGSRWITFGLGTAFALTGAVAIHLLSPWLDRPTVLPFFLACVSLPLLAVSIMCDGLARSYNWVMLALGPQTLLRPIVLFALMALAYLAGFPIDATTTMVALTVAIWSTALLQLVLVDRRLKGVVAPGPRTYEIRRWFAVALPVVLVWSFYTMLCYADVLMLQQFRPPHEVGHYYAAVKTVMLVGFIHFAVSAAMAHRFTALHVAGDRAELEAVVARSVRWTFWPSLGATLMMLALGKPILWLFGPDFVAGYSVMLILSVGMLARAAVGPAERLLNMLNQQRICAAIYAAALSVNVSLCVALVPVHGGVGAAFATSTAIVLESALLFVVSRRRLGLHSFFLGGKP